MFKKTLISLAVASSVGLTGCFDSGDTGANANPDYNVNNPAIDGKSYPRFNPVISDQFIETGTALPIPNDLLFQQTNILAKTPTTADGTFSDSAAAEPNPVENALGFLDGISTVAPIDLPFEGSIKESTVDARQFLAPDVPNPNQNVFLLELAYPGGDAVSSTSLFVKDDLDTAAYQDGISSDELTAIESEARTNPSTGLPQTKSVEIPVPAIAAGASPVNFRAEVIELDGGTANYLRITPLEPLKPQTRYLVVVTDSITDLNDDKIIKDPLFESVADAEAVLGNAGALAPVRDAALGWQSLAEAYFNAATNQAREAQSLPPIDRSNIALAYTATTGGTSAVLDSIANPASFFERGLRVDAKQEGIYKLVTGQLTLSAMEVGANFPSNSVADENKCLNAALIVTVTDSNSAAYIAELDPGSASYDESITSFAQLPNNTKKALAQSAVAGANEGIQNEDVNIPGYTCGDGLTFAQVAAGTEGALAGAVTLPQPGPRATAFYTDDLYGGAPQPAAAFGLDNAAEIHLGQIELPYYLQVPTSDANAASALTTPWQANEVIGAAIDSAQGNDEGTTPPTDKVTYRYPFPGGETGGTTVQAPVLLQTPPNAGTEDGGATNGLPVIIYQHGIFGERGHSLALGNQLIDSGFATIAIDLPLHGVAPLLASDQSANPLLPLSVDYASSTEDNVPAFKQIPTFADLQERHFGYATGATPITYGENAFGTSGANYLNLQVLPLPRDAARQAVVDLMNLNASIATIDFDNDGTPDLDPSRVYFVGHSLGGIVGTTFVATNNKAVSEMGNADLNEIQAAALITSGGGIARLLENSPSIAPTVLQGLAAGNVTQGSSSLEIYLSIAQATVDSSDSINFAQSLADQGTPVYANEIYGDGSSRATQDQTVPIAADTLYAGDYTRPLGEALPAPLAGTEPLLDLLDATAASTDGAVTGNVAVRFNSGTHTTIIRPTSEIEEAVFADMATNIGTFFATGGSSIAFFGAAPVVVDGDPTED
jgi:dienelactone hydrolase